MVCFCFVFLFTEMLCTWKIVFVVFVFRVKKNTYYFYIDMKLCKKTAKTKGLIFVLF